MLASQTKISFEIRKKITNKFKRLWKNIIYVDKWNNQRGFKIADYFFNSKTKKNDEIKKKRIFFI